MAALTSSRIMMRPLPSPLPTLVVCDLDWTLWARPRFRNGPPWVSIDDGLGGIRASSGETLRLYDGARRALATLADLGVPVALASRTHRKRWALEWMQLLRVDESRTLAAVVGSSPIVITDGAKASHLREISKRAQVPFEDMLFFDDSYKDILHVEQLGCTAVHCPRSQGLTDEVFHEGLERHARRLPRHHRDEDPWSGRVHARRRA